jgi:hypothetical protein
MPSKERLAAFAGHVKRNDEEYAPDGKFVGGRNPDERVPQRYVYE